MNRQTLIQCLIGAILGAAPGMGQTTDQASPVPAAPPSVRPATDPFPGYDFEQVVRRVETSVDPLQQEMSGPLKEFSQSVEQAQSMIEQGKTKEAMETTSKAMDEVLAGRDRVLTPMWDGQVYLQEQVARVRDRMAKAVQAAGGTTEVGLDQHTQTLLDGVAKRLAAEKDPGRRQRLIAHYKTVRQLGKIRLMAAQLSPNQQKLWKNVLSVLENTTLTHQQVLMGTEVLYAQFDAAAANLKEYQGLIDTVEGASQLLNLVKGLGQSSQGLAQFSQGMIGLQERMAGFNSQVEDLLQEKMVDLESQAQSVTETLNAGAGPDAVGSGQIDDELAQRLERLSTPVQSRQTQQKAERQVNK